MNRADERTDRHAVSCAGLRSAAALARLVAVVTPSTSAAALTGADYLHFTDRIAERLDRTWHAGDGCYVMGQPRP